MAVGNLALGSNLPGYLAYIHGSLARGLLSLEGVEGGSSLEGAAVNERKLFVCFLLLSGFNCGRFGLTLIGCSIGSFPCKKSIAKSRIILLIAIPHIITG